MVVIRTEPKRQRAGAIATRSTTTGQRGATKAYISKQSKALTEVLADALLAQAMSRIIVFLSTTSHSAVLRQMKSAKLRLYIFSEGDANVVWAVRI